jgi:hypothetical protein
MQLFTATNHVPSGSMPKLPSSKSIQDGLSNKNSSSKCIPDVTRIILNDVFVPKKSPSSMQLFTATNHVPSGSMPKLPSSKSIQDGLSNKNSSSKCIPDVTRIILNDVFVPKKSPSSMQLFTATNHVPSGSMPKLPSKSDAIQIQDGLSKLKSSSIQLFTSTNQVQSGTMPKLPYKADAIQIEGGLNKKTVSKSMSLNDIKPDFINRLPSFHFAAIGFGQNYFQQETESPLQMMELEAITILKDENPKFIEKPLDKVKTLTSKNNFSLKYVQLEKEYNDLILLCKIESTKLLEMIDENKLENDPSIKAIRDKR